MKVFIVSLIMSMLIQTNVVSQHISDTSIVQFYVNESLLTDDRVTNQPVVITIEEAYYYDQVEVYEQIDGNQTRLMLDWIYENNLYKAVYVPNKNQTFQLVVHIPDEQVKKTSYKITYDTIKPNVKMKLEGEEIDELPNYVTKQSEIVFQIVDEHLDISSVNIKVEQDDQVLYEVSERILQYVFDQEGVYKITGSAQDEAGNIFTFEKMIQVDFSVPDVHIYVNQKCLQSQTVTYYEDVFIEFFVEDRNFHQEQSKIVVNNHSVDSKWELRDDKWVTTLLFNQEDDYQIMYEVVDKANHAVKGMFNIHLDKSSPKVQLKINNNIVQKIDKIYKESLDVQLIIEESHLDLTNSYITVNNEKLNILKNNNTYIAQTKLTDGIYTLQYHFVDLGGRSIKYESSQFMIDTIAPKVMINTTSSQAIINKRVDMKVEINEEHIDLLNSKFWIEKNGKQSALPLQQIEKGKYQIVFQTDQEGSYRFHMEIYDISGNQAIYYLNGQEIDSWQDILFQIDKTKPIIQLKTTEQKVAQSQTVSIILCHNDLDWEHVQVLVYKDNKQIDYNIQKEGNEATIILKEAGEYKLKVQAYDYAGNQAIIFYEQYVLENELSFVIDRYPPTISYQLLNDKITQKRQDVSIKVEDKNLKEYDVEVFRNHQRYLYQEGLHSSNWNYSFVESEGDEANYEIVVYAIDYANNTTKESISFTIDHAPYETKLMLNEKIIKDGSTHYLNHQANLILTLYDSHEKEVILEVEKNGQVQRIPIKGSTYQWTKDIIDHKEDTYHLKLITIDQVNNMSEINFTIVLDRNLPAIQWVYTISNGAILSNGWIPILKGEQEDFYVISWSLWKNQKLVNYQWHEEIHEEGYYTLQVIIQDKAMNMNTLTYPLQFEIDRTPPNIQIRYKDDIDELLETNIPKKELVIEIVQNDPLKKEEEYFTSVMVNGKNILSSEKMSQVYVMPNNTDLNIDVEAIDQAGNKINKQWNFKVNQNISSIKKQKRVSQKQFMYHYIVGCCITLIILLCIMKRVKKHAV